MSQLEPGHGTPELQDGQCGEQPAAWPQGAEAPRPSFAPILTSAHSTAAECVPIHAPSLPDCLGPSVLFCWPPPVSLRGQVERHTLVGGAFKARQREEVRVVLQIQMADKPGPGSFTSCWFPLSPQTE